MFPEFSWDLGKEYSVIFYNWVAMNKSQLHGVLIVYIYIFCYLLLYQLFFCQLIIVIKAITCGIGCDLTKGANSPLRNFLENSKIDSTETSVIF